MVPNLGVLPAELVQLVREEDHGAAEAYLCRECGSADVTAEATTYWNVAKQDWEVSDFNQRDYCHSCESEAHIELKPLVQQLLWSDDETER